MASKPNAQRRSALPRLTASGLAAARARGVKLGNPRAADALVLAAAAQRAGVARFTAQVLPTIRQIQAAGAGTLQAIADGLAARGVPTPRSGTWTAKAVSRVL